VGKELQQARDDASLSRKQVIRRLSEYLEEEQALSLPTLKRIEAGTTSPDGYLLALLCDLYGLPRAAPYRATQKQATGDL
jgi:transcriptional regulator with XRE-family HTH domain